MSDPKRELAELAASLRWAVEREMDRGRERILMPAGTAGRIGERSPEAAVPEAEPAVGRAAAATGAKAPATRGAKTSAPEKAPAARRTTTAPENASAARAGTRPAAAPPGPSTGSRGNKLDKVPIEPEPADYAERMSALATLAEEASGCEKCGLCRTRTQVVFGTGAARTRVLFIGEAPGADEDRKGEPFVGRAGKLLDQIIDAVGFEREQVYIANILKCRPPNNRDPEPEEIEACTPYLEKQIELLQPKIICALGRFAGQFLTGRPKATMGSLRGTLAEYKGIPVLPIYHPAALLRNPGWKRQVWEDVQVLREEYLKR